MSILLFIIGLYCLFKGKYQEAILSAIVLATNCFDTIKVVDFPVRHEMGDLGLALFICIWWKYLKDGNPLPITTIWRWLLLFAVFLIVSFGIDILINPISFGEVVLTGRRFLLFIVAYIIIILDDYELLWVLKSVIVINMILLLMLGLQYIGVISIFSYNFDKYVNKDFLGFYAPLSLMASAFVLLSPLGKKFFPKWSKYFLIICTVAILLTVIRSYIISYVIGIVIVLTMGQKVNKKTIIALISMAVVLIVAAQYIPQVGNRFSQVGESMETGSMAFRNTIIDKAIILVGADIKNLIFGLGWKYLDFSRSASWTLSDWVLATPDTSWPPLFGRLGFVGTTIYLIPMLIMLYDSYKYRMSLYAPVLAALLIHFIIISFAGNSLALGKTFILPYILYFLMLKDEDSCQESQS